MEIYKELLRQYLSQLNLLYDNDEITALLKTVIATYNSSYRHTLNKIDEKAVNHSLLVLEELKTGKPLQHILGKAYFYNLNFLVNKHTLIPRPETEELVYLIIQNHKNQAIKILDIGTGSGCIPISLKKNLDLAQVSSLDISQDALAVALENAKNHNVDIVFYHDDALHLDHHKYPEYDVIVSNPPYIKLNEKPEMHQNVLDFEPHLALFVENDNALVFYDKIGDFAFTNLNENGCLYFEINQYLAEETKELLIGKGFNVEIIKDINSNNRFVKAWF